MGARLINATSAAAVGAAVYVGDDWLLYVDASGGYSHSEMAAPCLLLGQPGQALRVQADDDAAPLCAAAMLHAAGGSSCSAELDVGAAFLYWDPLSAAGRALTQLCQHRTLTPWTAPALPGWEPGWFQALCHGMVDRSAVLAWVAQLRTALLAAAPQPDADWRLRTVAALLREDLACRLSVGQLAERARWSPEHLRKAFREAAGMSLSRYQMWSRLHRLVDAQRTGLHDTTAFSAEDSLLEAGFYDAPHGSRAVRRYFGLTAGAALQPSIRRADCHGGS
jgi:AraC-like DNA-binding protein